MRPNRSIVALAAASASAWLVDVELDDQQVVALREGLGDLVDVSAGGNDLVTSVQGCLGNMLTHAATGTRYEPNAHFNLLLLVMR